LRSFRYAPFLVARLRPIFLVLKTGLFEQAFYIQLTVSSFYDNLAKFLVLFLK